MDELISSFTPSEAIALAAVCATVIAAMVSAGAVLIAVKMTDKRANERERRAEEQYREQVARDDRLHRQRIEREDLHRFSNERRQAYASFQAGCVEMFCQVGAGKEPPHEFVMEVNRFFVEIELMARPIVAESAKHLWEYATAVYADPSLYKSRERGFDDALDWFRKEARDEVALVTKEDSDGG
jgi:hypothetical protein